MVSRLPGDTPVPGFYAPRLVKKGPRVAVRIWFGRAVIDGEVQDRGLDWRVQINDRTDSFEYDDDTGYRCRIPLDVMRVWPHCARWPIQPDEYLHLLRLKQWAEEHAPDHPAANVYLPIDLKQLKPLW